MVDFEDSFDIEEALRRLLEEEPHEQEYVSAEVYVSPVEEEKEKPEDETVKVELSDLEQQVYDFAAEEENKLETLVEQSQAAMADAQEQVQVPVYFAGQEEGPAYASSAPNQQAEIYERQVHEFQEEEESDQEKQRRQLL